MLLKTKLKKQDNAGHLFYFIFFNKQNKNKNTHTHTHIHTQKKTKKENEMKLLAHAPLTLHFERSINQSYD